MSTTTDLIARARAADPQLAADLEKHLREQSKRRTFGLVYEQHLPEAVELPGVKPRRGSKVHVLLPRDASDADRKKGADKTLWTIDRFHGTGPARTADLTEAHPAPDVEPRTTTAPAADLVVVSEFEDTIYPGLIETGRVQNAPDGTPEHVVINAENYHALEMLTYTHRHAVDVIYIDPPYNTGAKDWKYNNDYVASDDDYRHSKWLSFMERRLRIAKELLDPESSVLIVTIDEKEYLRLGILLEQILPEARIQMISSVINPSGAARGSQFARTDEYVFVAVLGRGVKPVTGRKWSTSGKSSSEDVAEPYWRNLRQSGSKSLREDRPAAFYPIFFDPSDGSTSTEAAEGRVPVYPIRPDGAEGRWQLSPETFEKARARGYVRTRLYKGEPVIQYLALGEQKKCENGIFEEVGKESSGASIFAGKSADAVSATTHWNIPSHSARHYGATVIRALLGEVRFDYPKSLYAVEDVLRFFVKEKPCAVILDFFSGSGTTAHAVMRLNRQDGGHRRSISVTNNEVSAEEQTALRRRGVRPGDPEWERLGICDYVTKPRVEAAITGRTPAGDPIKGDYKFTDESPMSEGFQANARFFTLTYETPESIRYNDSFSRIGPMLWMRAGQAGECITDLGPDGWAIADTYAVIENIGNSDQFLAALDAKGAESMRIVYVITNDSGAFQQIAQSLPESVEMVQLYESYLSNFEINTGRKG